MGLVAWWDARSNDNNDNSNNNNKKLKLKLVPPGPPGTWRMVPDQGLEN